MISGVNLRITPRFSLGVRPTMEPRVGSRLNIAALLQVLNSIPWPGDWQRICQYEPSLGLAARHDAGSPMVCLLVS